MKMFAKEISLLLWIGLSLGMFGCVSVESPPWVMGASEQYPSQRYLVGVGQGSSQSVAEERGYAAVAKIFSAHVQSRVRDTEGFNLVEKNGAIQTQRELAFERSTNVTTNKVLNNVQILDRWVHPETKVMYALAGLDRQQVERGLVGKIQAYDRTIDDELQVARETSDKFMHIGKLKQAIHVLQERETVNTDLRVIRESGKGNPSPYRLNELMHELNTFITEQFLVDVVIRGEHAPDVISAIVKKLGQEGLSVMTVRSSSRATTQSHATPKKQVPDLLIKGVVRVWDIDSLDPLFVYARWCGDLQIIDQLQQRVVGVVSRSGREGHVTSREARARASAVMQSSLAQEVGKTLFSSRTRNSFDSHEVPRSPCLSN